MNSDKLRLAILLAILGLSAWTTYQVSSERRPSGQVIQAGACAWVISTENKARRSLQCRVERMTVSVDTGVGQGGDQ